MSAFKEFLRAQPNNIDALTQLGFTYVFMDQNENAVASLRQVIRLKPDADVYGPLGLAYLGLKQYADAVAAFKETVRQKPKVGQSYYFLGYAYLSMGKKEDALQVYRTLQTVDSSSAGTEPIAEIEPTELAPPQIIDLDEWVVSSPLPTSSAIPTPKKISLARAPFWSGPKIISAHGNMIALEYAFYLKRSGAGL